MDEIGEHLLQQPGYASIYQDYLSQVCDSHKEVLHETITMVRQSVTDQVRNFPFLCHFLASSAELNSQTAFHLPKDQCVQLVEVYFRIEEDIVRELLLTKLKLQNRKGMEVLAEKTKKTHHAVKRTHDNVRAIYQLSSKNREGSIVGHIQETFRISKELAEKYILISFLGFFRFDISKRSLVNVKTKHFMQMAQLMASNWCTFQPVKIYELQNLQLNKQFGDSLRTLKTAVTRELVEEYKQLVLTEFSSVSADKVPKVEKELSLLLKNLLSLGATISHVKDFKDFFGSLIEKIKNLLKDRMELNIKEVRGLIMVTIASFDPLHLPQEVKEETADSWPTFLKTIGECVRVIYQC